MDGETEGVQPATHNVGLQFRPDHPQCLYRVFCKFLLKRPEPKKLNNYLLFFSATLCLSKNPEAFSVALLAVNIRLGRTISWCTASTVKWSRRSFLCCAKNSPKSAFCICTIMWLWFKCHWCRYIWNQVRKKKELDFIFYFEIQKYVFSFLEIQNDLFSN